MCFAIFFIYNKQKLFAIPANEPASEVPCCKITSGKSEMIESCTLEKC